MTDRFHLVRQLGSGGMGTVWLAQDTLDGSVLALKVLHGHLANDPDYLARFENEVQLAQSVRSPRVVQVYGYGSQAGSPYLAMEFVRGESLKENIRERGPFAWHDAKPVLRQAAEGLAAAHAAGVVHRDIKPSNILVTPEGDVKLADFGVSRALDAAGLTRSNTLMGTPAYMAPEARKDERSDLYALGCVLFEMLTGRQPASGGTPQEVMLGHLQREPDLALIPDGQARRVTGWLLQKDPRRRPASAAALIGALDGTTVIPGGTLRTRNASRRPSAAILLAPVAGLALLGGLAMGYASTRGGSGDAGAQSANDEPAAPSATNAAPYTPAGTVSPTTRTAIGGPASGTAAATRLAATETPSTVATATRAPQTAPASGATFTATRPAMPTASPAPAATATPMATAIPTQAPSPAPPAAAPSPTAAPTATATPAPNYFLDISFDKFTYQVGEPASICYELTPNTPFHFSFWKSVDGGPKELVVQFNDDGLGGCIQSIMGGEGFREYTFEARINGVLVAMRLAHAQVGSSGVVTSVQ